MNAQRKTHGKVAVSDYLTQQIAISGKSQKDIAEELEYPKQNIITMFKQGKTKIPLNKVPKFAKVLGLDPVHLLRLTMSEYSPETWDTIEQVLGGYLVTANEAEILNIIRETAQGLDVAPKNDEDRLELMTLAAKWRDRDIGLAQAAVDRKD